MVSHGKSVKGPRVAGEIMAGMRELEQMMNEGKKPEDLFTAKRIAVPEPTEYTAARVRKLRATLGVSQVVFAELMGVSVVLVKSWERGVREPSALARRLMDTVQANPAEWLSGVRAVAAT